MSDRLIDITGGYGSVYKKVMKDTELSIEAKAIYAYLTSYAGGKDTAFPSVSLICHELNISKNRFYNHRKELVEKEIISVKRERTDNGFSKNIYTINHHFVRLNFVDIQNVDIQNVDIQNVDIQNVDIQNVDIQNKDTKNNSTKNNNIKNNNNKNNTSATDVTRERFENWWKLYDKKLDKKKAFSLFKSALKKHSYETIMDGTREYLKTITNKKYQKYPKTFLSQESYMNDFTEEINPTGQDQLERMKYDSSYWD
ncbi:MAG: helix-turn-helix domain-containing protein [Staphylococcus equorum]|nr:helix-turn-helix domain-containing protein [Staphylococcus equorum]MDN6721358.1 helix-turn-helix domain-containing protein [Staphylococcus equorum]MDN6741273.1 helix-turn-helix domain-containing protein [Staphylococcus equorum]MDN6750013.1 helix-turn-helix domain-containing protein [Staphylococcus equorum]